MTSPAEPTATFYYDLGSPYAYLTAERIDDVLPSPAEWKPVLLGGIFKVTGRSTWGLSERRAEGQADVERRVAEAGLPPVRWPEGWPANGLQAMRAAAYAHRLGRGREFALAAFRAQFVDGRPLLERDTIAEAAARSGLDPEAVLAASQDDAVKDLLRRNTDEAIAAGVFGVPTVLVAGRPIWGDDRLEEAAERMREVAAGALAPLTADEARAFAARWLPAWTGNDPERLASFYSEDAFYADPAIPAGVEGRAALTEYFERLLGHNPDWVWTNRAVTPFPGGFVNYWHATIPVGEETIECDGVCLVHLRDGLIERNEVFFDRSPLLAAMASAA